MYIKLITDSCVHTPTQTPVPFHANCPDFIIEQNILTELSNDIYILAKIYSGNIMLMPVAIFWS